MENEDLDHYGTVSDVWRRSDKRADDGAVVWIVCRHWKKIDPQSYSLHAGTVEHADDGSWRVAQNDECGNGSVWWVPEGETGGHEDFFAWAYNRDVSLPPRI